jgi:hypothetical protein
VPFAVLYSPIDSIYGWRPIEVGHSAVITLQMSGELATDTSYMLRPPPGIAVETPPDLRRRCGSVIQSP